MELNVTLFIQMLNFLIAWLLLHKLYFGPAIFFLDKQQQERDQRLTELEQWKYKVVQKSDEIDHVWSALRLFSKEHQPEISQSELFVFKHAASSIEQPELDKTQIGRLTDELTQDIIAKVIHVDI